jgi:hypothetical protein
MHLMSDKILPLEEQYVDQEISLLKMNELHFRSIVQYLIRKYLFKGTD